MLYLLFSLSLNLIEKSMKIRQIHNILFQCHNIQSLIAMMRHVLNILL